MPLTRIERDVLGPKKIPLAAYYGIHTARAAENFQISNQRIPKILAHNIARIKIAAAQANSGLGLLDLKKALAIKKAARELIAGKFDNQLIIDVYQAGAGTPWHMNINEIITNRALQLLGKRKGDYKFLHPHEHTNMAQSTNDVMPTAIRLSSLMLIEELAKAAKGLLASLSLKAKEFDNVIKSGRTHLTDAVPIRLGQEFFGWATAIGKNVQKLEATKRYLRQLNLGSTAVGTGITAHPKFARLAIVNLRKLTKLDVIETPNKFEATQSTIDFAELSSILRLFAIDLTRICNDLRLLSSGPRTGLNEIQLPAVEPGSSIMPGKINPSIPEAVNMVCYQIIGNDATIATSSSAGQLELNVMLPVIAHNLIQSLDILINGISTLDKKCIRGVKVNIEVCRKYFENSFGLAAVLNPYIGYEKAAKEIYKETSVTGKSMIDVVKERNILSEKDMKLIFNPYNVTSPFLLAKGVGKPKPRKSKRNKT